ncbi:MAG: RNA methyltransferase [Roseburia sp.]|nr:RNA methyltransferase [Roseburia sp.]
MIESISNTQVKKINKLKKNARLRRQEKCFIAEGFKLVEEALSYEKVQKIYVSTEAEDEYLQRISHKISENCIEWVSPLVFREISDTATPQGILALVEMPEYDREKIIKNEEAALICLEDIRDPGNLGTIIRTAEGAGMSAFVMSVGCVDLFNPKVVRATMGAMFRMPFYITENMTTEVEQLRKEGFTFYAAQLDGTKDYTECGYQGKTGLLIGNESDGITPETSEAANEKIKIPMEGGVESLNAAVSAAILMYEVHRKRRI